MFNIGEHRLGNRVASNVSVTGSPTLLASQNPNRKSLVIQNNGSTNVYLGDANVSASGPAQGLVLAAGQMFTDSTSSGAWYGISGGTTSAVLVLETS
jgi:hypothetical protein